MHPSRSTVASQDQTTITLRCQTTNGLRHQTTNAPGHQTTNAPRLDRGVEEASEQVAGYWGQQYNSDRPKIMGILNVTPDSFFDGGRYYSHEKALEHAHAMITAGADILDIGGESTRPGARPISVEEEYARVLPIIEALHRETNVLLSIDTTKPLIMEAALKAGAHIINDINGLDSPESRAIAAKYDCPVVLMHKKGIPSTMQLNPTYDQDIVDTIHAFFNERIQTCIDAGIAKKHLILDVGFGFGKTHTHNLRLMRHLSQFRRYALPILIGVSRKSTVGAIIQKTSEACLVPSITMAIFGILQGAHIVRVHDVQETRYAIDTLQAIEREGL